MAVAMFFMPESPYFLITKGRLDVAEKSLSWLRGKNYDIKHEIEELQATHQDQIKTGSVQLKQIFTEVTFSPRSSMANTLTCSLYHKITSVYYDTSVKGDYTLACVETTTLVLLRFHFFLSADFALGMKLEMQFPRLWYWRKNFYATVVKYGHFGFRYTGRWSLPCFAQFFNS